VASVQLANNMDEKKFSPEAQGMLANFQSTTLSVMKEGMIFSLLSILMQDFLSEHSGFSSGSDNSFKKDFIKFWKGQCQKDIQNSLAEINKALNSGNSDLLNIISNQSVLPSVEDYQHVINSNMKLVEGLFDKITSPPK
jgi:hypothetical protein